jgi:hypothetical protein
MPRIDSLLAKSVYRESNVGEDFLRKHLDEIAKRRGGDMACRDEVYVR